MAEVIDARARYLRDFAHAVSHEFKTPLTGIRGALELLDEHGEDMAPGDRRRFLDNAMADAERLSRLVQRLLDLARADMASGDTARGDVRAAAQAVAARLASGIAVTVEAPAPLPPARISDDVLETVLESLIDNSRQAGATQVTIAILRRLSHAVIEVRDDGPGIPPGDQDRVFELFFTGRRAAGSTGLGLPIARSLLSITGGAIALVPSACGAAFAITLPLR
jgi:two-component system, OmpR family, sensor histidine kinase ChvG